MTNADVSDCFSKYHLEVLSSGILICLKTCTKTSQTLRHQVVDFCLASLNIYCAFTYAISIFFNQTLLCFLPWCNMFKHVRIQQLQLCRPKQLVRECLSEMVLVQFQVSTSTD